MTDIFDTIGTLIGTGEKVGIIASTGDNNESKALDRALYSDLVGTSIGAIAGTSNVTTYVESAAGIGAGGRTGLTALVVAVLFAISSFFSPVVSIVPNVATLPILIIVGVMMLSNLKSVDWEDLSEAIPRLLHFLFSWDSHIALPMVSQLVSLLILWSKSSKVKLRMSTLLCGFWISCLSLTSSVWLCSKA